MYLYGVENKHKTVIMKLDRYKQAVLETYLNTTSNIFVNATAGSGKTTMLLRLLEATPSYKESLFLAFNKSIVNELESRVMGRGEVKTIHSKAYSTLLRNKKCRFKLSKWRDYSICKKYLNFSEKLDDKGVNARIMNISRIWNLIRVNLLSINDMEGIQQACLRWDIDFDPSYYEDMKKFVEKIEEETNGLKVQSLDIDFTDQLYLTWKYIPETLYQKYDVIFCDEAQDLNPLQRELILRMLKPSGRLVVCGDYAQCQPAGTKVLMYDGSYKNIEDLVEGDHIVSYEYRHDNRFVGDYSRIRERSEKLFEKYKSKSKSFIRKIASRDYSGYLYEVGIGELKSAYTPEHICYVKWKPEIKNKYALYLMQKGNWFRIGITPYSLGKTNTGGFWSRFNCEGADNAWLLGLYDDRREARFNEIYLSYKYGIPQTIFVCRKGNDTILGQEGINDFYNKFGDDLYTRALKLLECFDRRIDCPFISKREKDDSRWKVGSVYMFNTYACNVFPDLMQMIIYEKGNYSKTTKGIPRTKPEYRNIDSWNKIPYRGKVYSLDVNYNQNYVADGILTHNCIYSFQGSSSDSFHYFENMSNMVSLPLSISYRCPRKVVEYARQYSENIEACDDAIEGVVRPGTIEEVKAGDYVLCRNNLPLVEAFIKLLKSGKKSLILGKDYGDGLLRILLRVETVRDLINLLYEKREELKKKGVNNFSANEAYVSLLEKVEILKILFAETGSMMKVRGMVEDIFSDDENKENIILSTIHKSKGLEADKVFLLGFHELIPSKYATTELALYGEKCLQFVAVTRAKKELIFIPYKSKENVKEETETVY